MMRRRKPPTEARRALSVTLLTVAALLAIAWISSGCEKSKGETQLVILMTNDTRGELWSCGCKNKDYGGLGRRATVVAAHRDTTKNLLVVETGEVFGLTLAYGSERAEVALESMKAMGYDAMNLGPADFSFGPEFLEEKKAELDFPFVTANIGRKSTGRTFLDRPYIIREFESGLKVGIIGVTDHRGKFPGYTDHSDLDIQPALERLHEYLPEVEEKADVVVLLSHLGATLTQELIDQTPGLDVVLIGGGGQAFKSAKHRNGAVVFQAGNRGKYLGYVSVRFDGDFNLIGDRAYMIPMAENIPDNGEVARIFKKHGLDVAKQSGLVSAEPPEKEGD